MTSLLKIYLIANIGLVLSINGFSQSIKMHNNTIQQAVKNNESATITATLFINEHPSKKEQYFNEWADGSIEFKDGGRAINCKLQYNIWKDELIWLRETDYKMGTVIKELVDAFTIYADTPYEKNFINYAGNSSLIKQNVYLEVLTEGRIALYCHHKATYNKSGNRFSTKQQYYLNSKGKMQKVKLNKKGIMNSLQASDQANLKTILQDKHLKIKHADELSKAIGILNKSNEK